jgi:hypothetical protein
MDPMNNVIDHYILHEISELRNEERHLGAALAEAHPETESSRLIRALTRLHARMDEFDAVLDQLDVVAVAELAVA